CSSISYIIILIIRLLSSHTCHLYLSDALPILSYPSRPIPIRGASEALSGALCLLAAFGLVLAAPVPVSRDAFPLWDSSTKSLLRSEEHTSELQSREKLVYCLLLEKKKYVININ